MSFRLSYAGSFAPSLLRDSPRWVDCSASLSSKSVRADHLRGMHRNRRIRPRIHRRVILRLVPRLARVIHRQDPGLHTEAVELHSRDGPFDLSAVEGGLAEDTHRNGRG